MHVLNQQQQQISNMNLNENVPETRDSYMCDRTSIGSERITNIETNQHLKKNKNDGIHVLGRNDSMRVLLQGVELNSSQIKSQPSVKWSQFVG